MSRAEQRKTITRKESIQMRDKFVELINQNSKILIGLKDVHERLLKIEDANA